MAMWRVGGRFYPENNKNKTPNLHQQWNDMQITQGREWAEGGCSLDVMVSAARWALSGWEKAWRGMIEIKTQEDEHVHKHACVCVKNGKVGEWVHLSPWFEKSLWSSQEPLVRRQYNLTGKISFLF